MLRSLVILLRGMPPTFARALVRARQRQNSPELLQRDTHLFLPLILYLRVQRSLPFRKLEAANAPKTTSSKDDQI